MFQSLAEDLIAFAGDDADIEVVRLAILPDQTTGLPTAPPKPQDSRRYDRLLIHARSDDASQFVAIDSLQPWQVEALEPPRLAAIVRQAIEQRLDRDVFEDIPRKEEAVRRDVLQRLDGGG
jgi:hypothetical protein